MKILLLNGSPRPKGNTAAALDIDVAAVARGPIQGQLVGGAHAGVGHQLHRHAGGFLKGFGDLLEIFLRGLTHPDDELALQGACQSGQGVGAALGGNSGVSALAAARFFGAPGRCSHCQKARHQ